MQIFITSPSSFPWITPVVAGVFTISGVWLGSFLNQRSGARQAHQQQMRELRIRSYAKIMGIKIPLSQAVRTNGEAKILCEYYDARFHLLGDRADLEESKKQNDRALGLIPEISVLRRELSQTLGEVQIAFPTSKELDSAIQTIYKSSALEVSEVRGKFASVADLEEWRSKVVSSLTATVQSEYSDKVQKLLDVLYPLTDRA